MIRIATLLLLCAVSSGSVELAGHRVKVERWKDGRPAVYSHRLYLRVPDGVTRVRVTARRGWDSESVVVRVRRSGSSSPMLAKGSETAFSRFLDPDTERGRWNARGDRYVGRVDYYSGVTWRVKGLR